MTAVRLMLRSRLFGAWSFSMVGRSASLVPIGLLATRGAVGDSYDVRLYIAGFAYLAGASYVLNVMNEARLFSKVGGEHSPSEVALQSGVVVGCSLIFISPLLSGAHIASVVWIGLAVGLQALTAKYRVRTIDSHKFRGAYASTGLRDLPAAVVSIGSMLITEELVRYLPFAMFVGALLQLVQLILSSRNIDRLVMRSSVMHRPAAAYSLFVALAAIALASYQPLARLFAELSAGSRSLSLYELADRPAYVVALALAGGVGTELQRRWRESNDRNVVRELAKIQFIVIAAMLLMGCVATYGAYLVRNSLAIFTDDRLIVLIPLAFLAETAYLLAVLRTRLIMANGSGRPIVVAYGAGLLVMSCSWIVWSIASPASALVAVPIASMFGFGVACSIQHIFIRKMVGVRGATVES